MQNHVTLLTLKLDQNGCSAKAAVKLPQSGFQKLEDKVPHLQPGQIDNIRERSLLRNYFNCIEIPSISSDSVISTFTTTNQLQTAQLTNGYGRHIT